MLYTSMLYIMSNIFEHTIEVDIVKTRLYDIILMTWYTKCKNAIYTFLYATYQYDITMVYYNFAHHAL